MAAAPDTIFPNLDKFGNHFREITKFSGNSRQYFEWRENLETAMEAAGFGTLTQFGLFYGTKEKGYRQLPNGVQAGANANDPQRGAMWNILWMKRVILWIANNLTTGETKQHILDNKDTLNCYYTSNNNNQVLVDTHNYPVAAAFDYVTNVWQITHIHKYY